MSDDKLIEAMARAMRDHLAATDDDFGSLPAWSELPAAEQEMVRDLARAALAALTAGGYLMAPIEPTEAMQAAGSALVADDYLDWTPHPASVWRAMIAAAQPSDHFADADKMVPQTDVTP